MGDSDGAPVGLPVVGVVGEWVGWMYSVGEVVGEVEGEAVVGEEVGLPLG